MSERTSRDGTVAPTAGITSSSEDLSSAVPSAGRFSDPQCRLSENGSRPGIDLLQLIRKHRQACEWLNDQLNKGLFGE